MARCRLFQVRATVQTRAALAALGGTGKSIVANYNVFMKMVTKSRKSKKKKKKMERGGRLTGPKASGNEKSESSSRKPTQGLVSH